ncbi:MAG TPA: hypothetical protein ENG51_08580, partial [Deltaproteobacteria bacterium]|nr:hypothetical protein [Deltaproteobacteria bacterium]
MKVKTGDAIRKITLQARKLLMEEVSEQLEGIYGLLPDGELQHVREYPVLATIDEAAATRERLEKFMESQKEAGVNP